MFSDVFLGIEKVWLNFGGFAVTFEQFSYINLGVSIVDFEQLPGGGTDSSFSELNYCDFSPDHREKFWKWKTFLVEDISVYRENKCDESMLTFL